LKIFEIVLKLFTKFVYKISRILIAALLIETK